MERRLLLFGFYKHRLGRITEFGEYCLSCRHEAAVLIDAVFSRRVLYIVFAGVVDSIILAIFSDIDTEAEGCFIFIRCNFRFLSVFSPQLLGNDQTVQRVLADMVVVNDLFLAGNSGFRGLVISVPVLCCCGPFILGSIDGHFVIGTGILPALHNIVLCFLPWQFDGSSI